MVSTKKTTTKGSQPSRGVLHKAFQPGKDGYAYLYHWVKFAARAPVTGRGKAAIALSRSDTTVSIVDHEEPSRAMRSDTTVSIVDHNMAATGDRYLVTLDLKQPKTARSSGQFSAKMLPPGTNRKQAEAWISSKEGKAWAAGQPVALSAIAIRMI
jgi:hypothetical protein